MIEPARTMAERPRAVVEIVVDAAPERVWAIVSDISLPVDGSAELQSVAWLDDADGPSLGARFVGNNARGDAEWSTTSTIVRCEVPTALFWAVEDVAEPVSTWGFELEPTEDGRTIVRQHVELGPGRSGLTWAIKQNPESGAEIIAGRLATLAKSMRRNLDKIAEVSRAAA